MPKDPILPLYYNDIQSSTLHWTDEEFGAYMRLLIHQWDKGSVPEDPVRLRRISETAKKNWDVLGPKFYKGEDGLLRNKKMEEVRVNREKFKEKQKGNVRNRYQNSTRKLPDELPDELPEGYQNSTKPPTKAATKNLPLETENEKGLEEFQEKPLPELGMQKTKQVANTVWEDQLWREQFCIGMTITQQQLKLWMAQFNTSVSNDSFEDFTASRYKKLFRGWLQKEKGKGNNVSPPEDKNALPGRLKTLNE